MLLELWLFYQFIFQQLLILVKYAYFDYFYLESAKVYNHLLSYNQIVGICYPIIFGYILMFEDFKELTAYFELFVLFI
jgi:hypothetical protein